MEYFNNKLCLTYDEYIGFFGELAYKNDKRRALINVFGLGGNGRKVLIEYDSLKQKRKDVIITKIGNPYECLAKQPILAQIDWDIAAHSFYSDYVLPNGAKLPASDTDGRGKRQINYVKRYTKAVSWLNMIGRFTSDKRALKSNLNLSVMEFWETVCELILKEEVNIPSNPKRLKEKLKGFLACKTLEERYISLIDMSKFGNERSKKIDEDAEAVLFKLFADGRNQDDSVITAAYNFWAKNNNREEVTSGAIGYFRRKNAHIIDPARMGMKKAYSKYTKEIHRDRASAPLLFINSDDNILDLFFEVERNGAKSKYYRPALYVIIDTFNDYILGYAYGDKVNTELIYAAFRNAANHIKELTGHYYLPSQLQTDRWGLDVKMKNHLSDFYRAFGGKFTPQAHGVPQGKYIERSFGTEWHQILKVLPSNNYAGNNITAKERLSAEYITMAAKDYPSIEQMPSIIEGFIKVMRLKANPKTKISRQHEWVQAFIASEKSKKRQIDTGVKLELCGVKHALPVSITSAGIQFTINKQKFTLDVPDMVIYEHNGKKVEIIYDPEQPTEFLVTDNYGLRFVTGLYENRPGAIADYKDGDRLRLQSDFDNKKQISQLMATAIQERMSGANDVDAQGLLQAGVLLKDAKHGAEADYIAALWGGTKVIEKKKELPVPQQDYQDEEINRYDLY